MDVSGLVGQVHRRGISVAIGLHAAERTASSMLGGKLCDMVFSTVATSYIRFSSQGSDCFKRQLRKPHMKE